MSDIITVTYLRPLAKVTVDADFRIPSFQALMLPTLSALEDRRGIAFSEVWARTARAVGLTTAKERETLSAGKRMEFANRMGRCLTHMRHAGLVERVERGIYRLTAEGCDLLSCGLEKIGLPLLRNYPAYREWLAVERADFDVVDRVMEALDRQGTDAATDNNTVELPCTEAVSLLWMVDDAVQFSIVYDAEFGMLPAFAEALVEYATCTTCGASPQAHFVSCPCGKDEPINASGDISGWTGYRIDPIVWENTVGTLWKRDRHRAYSRNSDAWQRRRERIRSSKDPSHTPADVELLREIQRDFCYYCGTSIREKRNVEHLVPLARGGSDGFDNIVLACPSCNRDKYVSTERQYWGKLRKRLSPEEYERRRARAKATKKEKQRRHPAGQLSSGPMKRKRLIHYR